MKEFIEKLIGRLEEIKSDNFVSAVLNEPYSMGICHTIEKSIEIVNQLAEEHKDNVMINGQYCWQTCGATEHCKECNRLCNGSIDYYENYDVLAEEYNNDFCEWKEDEKFNWFFKSPHEGVGIVKEESGLFNFCPYCGKKIKVVE